MRRSCRCSAFKKYTPHFEVLQYKTTDDFPYGNGGMTAAAMIEIKVGEQTEITAAVGNGPVNALDSALRRALSVFYPCISEMTLADFKVRVIDSGTSTAAKVRVLTMRLPMRRIPDLTAFPSCLTGA